MDVSSEMFGESDAKIEALTSELKNYLKCVKGDAPRFMALTEFGLMDGGKMDPECCAEITDKSVINRVMRDTILQVIADKPVDGKEGNWSCGCFGSRWMDLNAEKYGLDYVRVAFYSKKHYKGSDGWPHEGKHYAVIITAEKGK